MASPSIMQPSMTIAPSPTNARSCNVQPCSMAMWPTSTSSPMTVGKPPAPSLSLSQRSEEHTSELQSLMRISYAVFCLKKKKNNKETVTDGIRTDVIELQCTQQYKQLH